MRRARNVSNYLVRVGRYVQPTARLPLKAAHLRKHRYPDGEQDARYVPSTIIHLEFEACSKCRIHAVVFPLVFTVSRWCVQKRAYVVQRPPWTSSAMYLEPYG